MMQVIVLQHCDTQTGTWQTQKTSPQLLQPVHHPRVQPTLAGLPTCISTQAKFGQRSVGQGSRV